MVRHTRCTHAHTDTYKYTSVEIDLDEIVSAHKTFEDSVHL